MAELKKNSFILYAEQKEVIEELSFEEKGRLFDAIFDYVSDGTTPCFEEKHLAIAFKMFKVRICHDNEKYEQISEKRREAIKKRWENTKDTNEYKSIQVNTSEYKSIQNDTNDTDNDNDKDKDNDNDSLEPEGSMREGIIETPKENKKKPLWKESYDEWKRIFTDAKDELLKDSDFKDKQEKYYPNIDYEKSLEKNLDYWLQEEVWKEVKRKPTKTIVPKQRLKNNFDKNKIFLPLKTQPQQPNNEPTLRERHTAFVQWLFNKVHGDENAIITFHVSLDDFIEMLSSCDNDANKMANIVCELLQGRITSEEGLIGVFRKRMENGL